MIDEARTLEVFGYTSDELSPQSHKRIVVVCGGCGKHRVIEKRSYRDLCHRCAAYKQFELPVPIFVDEVDRFIEDTSIDRIATIEKFGYDPIDLSTKSSKKVVVICEICGKYRVITKEAFANKTYNDSRCHTCAAKREETKHQQSVAMTGKNHPFFGKHRSPESILPRDGENNGMYGKKHTEKSKQLMSAKLQNVPIEEWVGYSKEKRYCNMWTEKLRERVRNKFDRLCFMCDKDEKTNNRKLSVHHIGNDRNQGCNKTDWKLVPLCNSCHGKVSHDPDIWEKLITNVLNYMRDVI